MRRDKCQNNLRIIVLQRYSALKCTLQKFVDLTFCNFHFFDSAISNQLIRNKRTLQQSELFSWTKKKKMWEIHFSYSYPWIIFDIADIFNKFNTNCLSRLKYGVHQSYVSELSYTKSLITYESLSQFDLVIFQLQDCKSSMYFLSLSNRIC